jgi:hypothetical protein
MTKLEFASQSVKNIVNRLEKDSNDDNKYAYLTGALEYLLESAFLKMSEEDVENMVRIHGTVTK